MPTHDEESWAQLTTKVPKTLRRDMKLRCVQTDTAVMRFVAAAIREKLARVGTHQPARRVG
jgi:hypothetical protein